MERPEWRSVCPAHSRREKATEAAAESSGAGLHGFARTRNFMSSTTGYVNRFDVNGIDIKTAYCALIESVSEFQN